MDSQKLFVAEGAIIASGGLKSQQQKLFKQFFSIIFSSKQHHFQGKFHDHKSECPSVQQNATTRDEIFFSKTVAAAEINAKNTNFFLFLF
jgi:hypothetical protein